MSVDVTLTFMVVDVTLTFMVVDVNLPHGSRSNALTLMVVDVTLSLKVVDVTLTLMIIDVSLSNLDLSSTRMTCHIQKFISISIQYIQMFSRLEAELIQNGCPSLSKQTSSFSMNCNKNIFKTSWTIYDFSL